MVNCVGRGTNGICPYGHPCEHRCAASVAPFNPTPQSDDLSNDSNTIKASEIQIGGDHYKNLKIQPAYFAWANKLDGVQFNVIKYICRFRTRDGKKDLLKARHYIDLLLEWEYGHTEGTRIVNETEDET